MIIKKDKQENKVFPIIVERDFNRPYFQRGRYHFLIYCLDGSIKGERAGMYIPPVILFDNLNIYIQEKGKTYNLHKYIKKVELNISETYHYFDFKGTKIKLTYFVPEDFMGLQIFIESSRPLTFLFEPFFSFNYVWHENPVKEFDIFTKEGCVYARSKFDTKIGCMLKANKPLQLIKIKDKEKNKISIKGKNITITIAGSIKSEQNLRSHMQELLTGLNPRKRKQRKYEDRILDCLEFKCNDSELNRAFTLAKHNIRLLRHQQPGLGQGYLAGLPFFPEFFGRDTFWSIPGILSMGDFDCAKSNLNIFARHQSELRTETKKPGKIAHEIWLTGECDYYSIDGNPLFVHALHSYYNWTGDLEYLKDIFNVLKRAVECDIDLSKNHMLIHGPLGFLRGITWMDSITRSKIGVDVQALFVNELKLAAELATIVNEKKLSKRWLNFAKQAEKKLDLFWLKEGYYADRILSDKKQDKNLTPNALVLLLLGLADKKKADLYINKLTEKLLTPFGISTLEKNNKIYCPASYHHGTVWPLLSGWAALALLRYDKIEEAFKIIKGQMRFYETYVPGFAPECINAKTGSADFIISELGEREREKGSKPSWLQLWSSSLFLQTLIEGICGVRPLPPNKLKIEPKLPKELNYIELKSLRIFGSIVNIRIERKGQKIIKRVKVRKGNVKLV